MAGPLQDRNVAARSYRPCRADNDALRRLPRSIHQPLPHILKNEKSIHHIATNYNFDRNFLLPRF